MGVLIDTCRNLSNLAHFNTKQKHVCTVCGKMTESEELNRDIKTCQINIKHDSQNENIADMIKRTRPVDKICQGCHTMNAEGTGVSHKVGEDYTRLPQTHIISANRFNENQMKITLLEINTVTYYLKAVVKHNGGLEGGHSQLLVSS